MVDTGADRSVVSGSQANADPHEVGIPAVAGMGLGSFVRRWSMEGATFSYEGPDGVYDLTPPTVQMVESYPFSILGRDAMIEHRGRLAYDPTGGPSFLEMPMPRGQRLFGVRV